MSRSSGTRSPSASPTQKAGAQVGSSRLQQLSRPVARHGQVLRRCELFPSRRLAAARRSKLASARKRPRNCWRREPDRQCLRWCAQGPGVLAGGQLTLGNLQRGQTGLHPLRQAALEGHARVGIHRISRAAKAPRATARGCSWNRPVGAVTRREAPCPNRPSRPSARRSRPPRSTDPAPVRPGWCVGGRSGRRRDGR